MEDSKKKDDDDTKIRSPPRSPKDVVAFTDKVLKKLLGLQSHEDQIELLNSISRGEGYGDSGTERGLCFVEFTFSNVHFVLEKKIKTQLALVFIKSMNTAFRHAVKTNWDQRDESFRRFKEVILNYCKYSNVNLKEAHMMTDFATRTLFRVFHLFRNIFVAES
jgi:hypothetical protein